MEGQLFGHVIPYPETRLIVVPHQLVCVVFKLKQIEFLFAQTLHLLTEKKLTFLKLFKISDCFSVKLFLSYVKQENFSNFDVIYGEKDKSDRIYVVGKGSVLIKCREHMSSETQPNRGLKTKTAYRQIEVVMEGGIFGHCAGDADCFRQHVAQRYQTVL